MKFALCFSVLFTFVISDPLSEPEAWTLDGRPLYPPKLKGLIAAGLTAQLSIARDNLHDDACAAAGGVSDFSKLIWLGRRQAYMWQYREAIHTFSAALNHTTSHAMLYRHRGHRYITTRNFSRAETDLSTAAFLIRGQMDGWEEDGAPNAYNLPLYTKHFNVLYHLGLSRYLRGDFHGALQAYELMSQEVPTSQMTDESLVAMSHWRYMALRRLGKERAANQSLGPIHAGMRSLDGTAYLNLTLLYKGEMSPGDVLGSSPSELDLATVGYGVANWHWYGGRHDEAISLWRRVVNTSYWAAFGFIAAEAELHRLQNRMYVPNLQQEVLDLDGLASLVV